MKYYEEFKFPPPPADDLPGNALVGNDPVTAIGEVAIYFGHLEGIVVTAIACLLGKGDRIGYAVCSELSFRQRVHIFASLVRELSPTGTDFERLEELCSVLFRAEELRNQVLHSSWGPAEPANSFVRSKVTAKAKKGVHIATETLHVWQIMEITSWCSYAIVSCQNYVSQHFKLIVPPPNSDGA
jgi:hypothetical protein